jgi:hypothetical protein
VPPALFVFPYFLLSLLLQQLSQGSTDVPVLRAEVTRAREATTAMKVAVETSTQEAAVTRDSTTAQVKDVED